MSMDTGEAMEEAADASAVPKPGAREPRDLASMTEEEQIAYAMQMSMADIQEAEEPAGKVRDHKYPENGHWFYTLLIQHD